MRSEIACLTVTHDIPDEAMPWFERAREIFGRLVIFVDTKRAKPNLLERAKTVASAVHSSDSTAFFASDFRAMIDACESDWALYLDFDEELSPEWDGDDWRSLIRRNEFTHYLFPRRWILPDGKYISSQPWWPDLHLRLFRTDLPSKLPTKPHEALAIPGEGALFRTLSIHHHVLWLLDRSTREQKAQKYASLLPGGALEHYYLYEDFQLQETPVPKALELNWEEEILTMARLTPAAVAAVGLTVKTVPREVHRSTFFWIGVDLRNDTAVALSAAPPFPVRLSYHWCDAITGAVELFDGLRTELLPPVPASQSLPIEMVVHSPAQPGKYLLHLTIVQEQNFWFDQLGAEFGQKIAIEVT